MPASPASLCQALSLFREYAKFWAAVNLKDGDCLTKYKISYFDGIWRILSVEMTF